MKDEPRDAQHRDPQLTWIGAEWRSGAMPPDAAAATLRAYQRRYTRLRWRRVWAPLAAAALAVSLAVALVRVHPPAVTYRPVAQPRIIDLSQGERP